MPGTAERKRQRRAEQAAAGGKRFKPQKHPCLRELPLPPVKGAAAGTQEPELTIGQEMNRKSMDVEDRCVRVQGVMRASAPLLAFYAAWLQPKHQVRLRPHYERVLRLQGKERGLLHQLVKTNRRGELASWLWQRARRREGSSSRMCPLRRSCLRDRGPDRDRLGPPGEIENKRRRPPL